MNKLMKMLLVSTLLTFSAASNAIMLFDFTNTGLDQTVDQPYSIFSGLDGDLEVRITSSDWIYLDGTAGMGVCSDADDSGVPTYSGCGSDDNMETGEWLQFSFWYDGTEITDDYNFMFTVGVPSGHGSVAGAMMDVDGAFGDTDWDVDSDGTTETFFGHNFKFTGTAGEVYFYNIGIEGDVTPQCFPQGCDVPEPNNIAILALALIGLIGSRKFKRS